jgi:hypothetical protein
MFNSEQDIAKQNLINENKTRSDATLEKYLNKHANIIAEQAMINKLSSKYAFANPLTDIMKLDIKKSGFDALSNFKKEIPRIYGNDEKGKYINDISSYINVNYDYILDSIINIDRSKLGSYYNDIGKSLPMIQHILERAVFIKDEDSSKISPDFFYGMLNIQQKTFEELENNSYQKEELFNISKEARIPFIGIVQIQDKIKQLNDNVQNTLKNSIHSSNNISDLFKSSNVEYEKLLKLISTESKNSLDVYKQFNDFILKQNKTPDGLSKDEINRLYDALSVYHSNKRYSTPITKRTKEIKNIDYHDFIKIPEKNKFIPNKDGSVVKGPIHALVGEAGPEIIIPLNSEGIKFLNETMAEFKEENYKPIETQHQKHKNMIKRIKKSGKYTDTNMFDMKNLSSGLIRVG